MCIDDANLFVSVAPCPMLATSEERRELPRAMCHVTVEADCSHSCPHHAFPNLITTLSQDIANMVKTSFGPNGMNKMIINHLDKLFVTNDAATMIRELEVEHPAAKLLVMASEQQAHEVGDGTNFVIIFAGMLLHKAENLLHMVRECGTVTKMWFRMRCGA